ncbi:hypothetical protein H9L01_02430 [Erysipelothrix inopinata]|uniref:Uncharacterized protein n=1 Tax=Erysipelothrix inopinata TaxID=225084 RepID=A0A7G9S067_9FIRM|nr:hypothetical protein [Erysipelothrix inopinata]QNN61242.1 hypothetical protein H9L01_02430 [Erysipelothrix inopinata]
MIRIFKINMRNNFKNLIWALIVVMLLVRNDWGNEFAWGIALGYSSFTIRDTSIAQGYFKTLPFSINEFIKSMLLDTIIFFIITSVVLYIKGFQVNFDLSFALMVITWLSLAMYFKLNLGKNSKDFAYILLDLLVVTVIWILFSMSQNIIAKLVITVVSVFLDGYRLNKLKKLDFE